MKLDHGTSLTSPDRSKDDSFQLICLVICRRPVGKRKTSLNRATATTSAIRLSLTARFQATGRRDLVGRDVAQTWEVGILSYTEDLTKSGPAWLPFDTVALANMP